MAYKNEILAGTYLIVVLNACYYGYKTVAILALILMIIKYIKVFVLLHKEQNE